MKNTEKKIKIVMKKYGENPGLGWTWKLFWYILVEMCFMLLLSCIVFVLFLSS